MMAAVILVTMALLVAGIVALSTLTRQSPALAIVPVCLLLAGVVVFVLGGGYAP